MNEEKSLRRPSYSQTVGGTQSFVEVFPSHKILETAYDVETYRPPIDGKVYRVRQAVSAACETCYVLVSENYLTLKCEM
jgi:hypothetical protein